MPDTEVTTMEAEEVFERLVQGMVAFRAELHIAKKPTRDEIAAVWAWAQRVYNSDDFEASLFENVMDGWMWADYQGGSIVFRLSPAGTEHVEQMARERAGGSIDQLMRQMDMDPDRVKEHLVKKGES